MHVNFNPNSLLKLAQGASLLFAWTATTGLVHAQSAKSDIVTLDPVEVQGVRGDENYNAKRSITATRTDTALIDTAQSVSVVTRSFLDDQVITSIGDAMRYVPGVGTAQGEGNRDAIIFRGNSTTGDFFVDSQRDDIQYYRDFYNIERIEVLKGPAGMTFGRGSSGGAINRVTKQALIDGKSFYEVSAVAGSWDQYRSTFDFNQSLTDTVALRLNALYEDSDSFRDGVYIQREGINPTLGWALSRQTTLRFGFEYFHDERVADRGVSSINGRPFKTDASTFFGDPDRSPTFSYVRAISVSLDHEFESGATLRNATRYATYDKFYQNVYASGFVTGGGTVAIGAYKQETDRDTFQNQTDVVFKFDTGSIEHTLLTGLELSRQDTDNNRFSGSSTAIGVTALGSVSAANPRYNGPLFFNQSATDADNKSVAEAIGVYLQDQIQLLPKLQLVAGVRLDHFTVDFHNNRNGASIDSTDNLVSPRAGLVYKPVENLAVYTAYSLAYVPRSGEQLVSLSPTNEALDPEEFENYEVGVKWDARPNLSFTAAAYQMNRSNQAITDPTAGLPGGPPAGTQILVDGQQAQGFEFGASGKVVEGWSITGGYAYQDGKTKTTQGAILAGSRIAQLPRNTLSLWNRYDFNTTWGVGVGAIYRDELFAAADNVVNRPQLYPLRRRAVLSFQRSLPRPDQCRKHFRHRLLCVGA